MELQQNCIKNILTGLLVVLVSVVLKAEEVVVIESIRQEITIVSSKKIHIKVYAPKEFDGFISFKLNQTIPNYYLKTEIKRNISNFKVVFKDHSIKNYELTEVILIEKEFAFLEYDIELNSIEKVNFLPVSTYHNQSFSFINFATILGDFEQLNFHYIELSIFENKHRIYYENDSYDFFRENSFCNSCQTINLELPANNLTIRLNKNNIIKEKEFQDILKESIISLQESIEYNESDLKKMTFIFDTLSRNTGAITHSSNIVFHFNNNDKYTIQKTIIHELLHGYIPNQNSWLDESMVEYLALKTMLKTGLIAEHDFLRKMSEKMKSAKPFNNISLEKIHQDASLYKTLYTKGAVYSWMMDLLLIKKSNQKFSLEKYIFDIEKMGIEDISFIANELINFEKKYVVDNQKMYYNQFLNEIGILFEENKLQEIKPKQQIVLEKINDKIIIRDKAAICCLHNNDILISLDGKRKFDDIQKKLHSLSAKNSYFVVERNGKKNKYIISNKTSVMEKLTYNLSFIQKQTNVQHQAWLQYKN